LDGSLKILKISSQVSLILFGTRWWSLMGIQNSNKLNTSDLLRLCQSSEVWTQLKYWWPFRGTCKMMTLLTLMSNFWLTIGGARSSSKCLHIICYTWFILSSSFYWTLCLNGTSNKIILPQNLFWFTLC
jgi:hypothetical protein